MNEGKDAPQEVIPSHTAMPFMAAPASTWCVHHVFPGGLVFHTLTNLKNALVLGKNWEDINHIELNHDWLRAAPIWHDIAKTWVMRWMEDGSSTVNEGKIAGTSTHHILGIAEALMRKLPPDFVVVVASAHAPAHAPDELKDLIRFLQAAAIIAGVSNEAAGLTEDGSRLANPAPLESYIHHLSDHDWVGSEMSLHEAIAALHATFPDLTNWRQDEFLSRTGDLKVTDTWRKFGSAGVKKLFQN